MAEEKKNGTAEPKKRGPKAPSRMVIVKLKSEAGRPILDGEATLVLNENGKPFTSVKQADEFALTSQIAGMYGVLCVRQIKFGVVQQQFVTKEVKGF